MPPLPATVGLALGILSVAAASPASARVTFGDNDVRTVFYISKSDDRNRVDYGVRLDARCMPRGERPIFAYWHRFEPGQPRIGDLNELDREAYGIQGQAVRSRTPAGSWVEMRLRGFPSERILVLVQRDRDGRCTARARVRIAGHEAFLDHIHVELRSPLSVERVIVEGRDVETGATLRESRRPPRRALPRLGL